MVNRFILLRALRGAPITCLHAIYMSDGPVTAVWLVAKTGYSENTIMRALRTLSEVGLIRRDSSNNGWLIVDSSIMVELFGTRSTSDQQSKVSGSRTRRGRRKNSRTRKICGSAPVKLSKSVNKTRKLTDLTDSGAKTSKIAGCRDGPGIFSSLEWENLLIASEHLFGEPIMIPEGAEFEIEHFLALVAEAWCNRSMLVYPARVVYANLLRDYYPAEKYFIHPEDYLPRSFLEEIGLADQFSPEVEAGAGEENSQPDLFQDETESLEEFDSPGTSKPQETGILPDESLLVPITPNSSQSVLSAWYEIRVILQDQLAFRIFDQYMAQTLPEKFIPESQSLVLSTPDTETCQWIENRMSKTLWRVFRQVTGCEINIIYTVRPPPGEAA